MASNGRKVLLVSPDNKVERSTIEKKIDWYKCYICQKSTNEKLQCPANIVRSNFDPLKAYYEVAQNMIKLKEIDCIPLDIDLNLLDEGDGISRTLLDRKGLHHSSCRLEFRDVRVQQVYERKT